MFARPLLVNARLSLSKVQEPGRAQKDLPRPVWTLSLPSGWVALPSISAIFVSRIFFFDVKPALVCSNMAILSAGVVSRRT